MTSLTSVTIVVRRTINNRSKIYSERGKEGRAEMVSMMKRKRKKVNIIREGNTTITNIETIQSTLRKMLMTLTMRAA